jgi:hypothetical protein
VNEIARTRACEMSGVPTAEPRPTTMLNTPVGMPASSKQAARCKPVSGASWASFMTTVFPYASAGAAFQAGIAAGKFHGVIIPTTPSGRRVV